MTTRLKVALVSRALFPFHGYGGMEKYVHFLAAALARRNVDVKVITSARWSDEHAALPNIRFLATSFKESVAVNLSRYFSFMDEVCDAVENDTDIVHLFGIAGYRYLQQAGRRPTVVQAFDNEAMKIQWWKKLVLYYPTIRPLRTSMMLADRIASAGTAQDEEIQRLFQVSSDKIRRLTNGVDCKGIRRLAKSSGVTRRALGIGDGELVMATLCRLAPTKGLHHVMEALAILKRKRQDIRYLMIGSGAMEQPLLTYADRLGVRDRIVHLKNLPEDKLYGSLSVADVFVDSSPIEHIVLTVFEAMALGIPAVSFTDQEGSLMDGKNGCVARMEDAASIAACVLKLSKTGKAMRHACGKAAQAHDWHIIAQQAIAIYKELA